MARKKRQMQLSRPDPTEADFMDRYNTYWHVEKLGFKIHGRPSTSFN
jgi:hypothetical protein